jgi:glucose 1-dehydrogenase
MGSRLNNIAPGVIETPINTKLLQDSEKLNALLENIPLARLGKTSDVAGVTAFWRHPTLTISPGRPL